MFIRRKDDALINLNHLGVTIKKEDSIPGPFAVVGLLPTGLHHLAVIQPCETHPNKTPMECYEIVIESGLTSENADKLLKTLNDRLTEFNQIVSAVFVPEVDVDELLGNWMPAPGTPARAQIKRLAG